MSHTRCVKCRGALTRSTSYDALFCRTCDVWADKHCRDPHCDYCAERPARPSMAVETDEAAAC